MPGELDQYGTLGSVLLTDVAQGCPEPRCACHHQCVGLGFTCALPAQLLLDAEDFPTVFHFVVATPQDNAWMIAQSFDLLDGLDARVVAEGRARRRDRTAKHELLPDHQAKLVGLGVGMIRQVVPAAPVRSRFMLASLADSSSWSIRAGGTRVGNESIGMKLVRLGKDRQAIDDKFEAFAPPVVLPAQLDTAQAGLRLALPTSRDPALHPRPESRTGLARHSRLATSAADVQSGTEARGDWRRPQGSRRAATTCVLPSGAVHVAPRVRVRRGSASTYEQTKEIDTSFCSGR